MEAEGSTRLFASARSTSVMQPSIASDPPARPVPAPRVTTGTLMFRGPPQGRLNVAGGLGSHDRQRMAGLVGVRAVEPVTLDHVGIGYESARRELVSEG